MMLAGIQALVAFPAHADTFGSGPNTFTIDFVNIGNAGNADDAGAGGGLYSSAYGGVSYGYRMGTHEISQDAITKATASGLTNVTAGPWTGSQPSANITWFEAAAFANWLNTSTGHQAAYQIDAGLTALTPWTLSDAGYDASNLYRNSNAYYFLPSEDEWYKAAYHQNDGVTANYWDYATASNTAPTAVASGTAPGTAVYNMVASAPAAVNNAGGLSAYGTMGQNGNMFEWMESASDGENDSSSEGRAERDTSYLGPEIGLRSSSRGSRTPTFSGNFSGFRVASVPEPSCAMLIIGSGFVLLAPRRRARTV